FPIFLNSDNMRMFQSGKYRTFLKKLCNVLFSWSGFNRDFYDHMFFIRPSTHKNTAHAATGEFPENTVASYFREVFTMWFPSQKINDDSQENHDSYNKKNK